MEYVVICGYCCGIVASADDRIEARELLKDHNASWTHLDLRRLAERNVSSVEFAAHLRARVQRAVAVVA